MCETVSWKKKGKEKPTGEVEEKTEDRLVCAGYRKSTISSGISFICTCPLSASFMYDSFIDSTHSIPKWVPCQINSAHEYQIGTQQKSETKKK